MSNLFNNKFGFNIFPPSFLKGKNFFQNEEEFMSWFESRRRANYFSVDQIPFNLMDKWGFEKRTKNIVHDSGKFFRVEGLRVQTNFGKTKKWDQPIIVQPEIGILGIITKKVSGIRYYLMQLKMEPGNVNIIQLSPTVQATKSNYTQVHKGKLPCYLEYFLDRGKSNFLVDSLQTEQGGRFLRKRNRNMIVEVEEDIQIKDDFCWLTSGQIRKLLTINNFVNMDSRSVLSCAPFVDGDLNKHYEFLRHPERDKVFNYSMDDNFSNELLESMVNDGQNFYSMDQIISWFTELKTKYELHVEHIPLRKVMGWKWSSMEINHKSNRFFSVVAVLVKAGSREVTTWTQPLFKSTSYGLIGFVTKKINNILHFLVQAKVEPGNFDILEMAPTVSCSDYQLRFKSDNKPEFLDIFIDAGPGMVKYDVVQSEEGGRFYHFQNRCIVVEVDESFNRNVPDNYKWMSLGQMMKLVKQGYFNIEARSLLACIGLF